MDEILGLLGRARRAEAVEAMEIYQVLFVGGRVALRERLGSSRIQPCYETTLTKRETKALWGKSGKYNGAASMLIQRIQESSMNQVAMLKDGLAKESQTNDESGRKR